MKLNYFSLNTTLLGLSRLNNNVVKRRNTTVIPPFPSRPEGLIGQYKPYLNSNDSPTRSTLKDYSGLGNDIILYNFLYALGSGYGLYKADLNAGKTYNNTSGTDVQILERTSSKLIIKEIKITSRGCIYTYNSTSDGSLSPTNRECPSYKVKISNLPENTLEYQYISEDGLQRLNLKLHEGINVLPKSYAYIGNRPYIAHGFNILSTAQTGECNIIIEQIPDYPGALVSDGVDDYGLCENFPILTKENGYTIVAIRNHIGILDDHTKVFLSKITNSKGSCISFEYNNISENKLNTITFGNASSWVNYEEGFSFQTSKKYNNSVIRQGDVIDENNVLYLLSNNLKHFFRTAFYALEIYDHDLTDEETQSVKEAMYNEYLTATNSLQNHIIADYECYDKTNEDEDRDILKDLSGNGHDIQLYNFGFAEGSGYGKYAQNFNDWINNNLANIIMSKSYNKVRLDINSSEIGAYVAYITKINYNNASTYKVFCKSDLQDVKLEFGYNTGNQIELNINGITEIPMQTESSELYIVNSNRQVGYIELEIIPEYQGALVSDGVDDYGLCENFPILNKEDGYTILTIRKHITFPFAANTGFISKRDMRISIDIGTVFEKWGNTSTPESTCSFGLGTAVDIDNEKLFSYQTSNIYNGQSILVGSQEDNPCLILFGSTINESGKVVGFSNSALYAFKILNKDCTTEEIKFLAKQMIARHKEKTGETITLNI